MESPFGFFSTAEEVARDIQLTSKNVLVTGGNSGIGAEAARVFAKMGANVYIACRDTEKAKTVQESIQETTNNPNVHVLPLDLASFASIYAMVELWKEIDKPINILVNNAGVMITPYMQTKEGFEFQFGVNHLGHFLLTTQLLPWLKQGAPARVVNLSSLAHTAFAIRLNALGYKTLYDEFFGDYKAYSMSKSCNILFSMELDRRMQEEGADIRSNAVHPGVISTDLGRYMPTLYQVGFKLLATVNKSVPQGAATTVYVATAPELSGVGGKYFVDCAVAPSAGFITAENAKELWEISEKLIESMANKN